jgi:hypothetical protein
LTNDEREELDRIAAEFNVTRHALLRFAVQLLLKEVREKRVKLKDYVASRRSLRSP